MTEDSERSSVLEAAVDLAYDVAMVWAQANVVRYADNASAFGSQAAAVSNAVVKRVLAEYQPIPEQPTFH